MVAFGTGGILGGDALAGDERWHAEEVTGFNNTVLLRVESNKELVHRVYGVMERRVKVKE